MSKRTKVTITAVTVLLLSVILWSVSMTLRAYAAGSSEYNFETFDKNETFVIVPGHAGSSAVDLNVGPNVVKIHRAHKRANQLWRLQKRGDYYSIESVATGRVMEDSSGRAASGSEISTQDYSGSDSQLWMLDSAGDGTYFIRNKRDINKVLDVEGISTNNGTRVMVHDYNRGSNQRFRFMHFSTVEPMSDWGASRHDCYAADFDIWDGGVDTSWYYANRDSRVYRIDSARKLAGLSKLVREGTTNFDGQVILLKKDINLAGIEWPMIGTHERPFRGSFNGENHAITGLSITTPGESYGFFGEVERGSITNFAIKGSVCGDWNTGGVVGNMSSGHLVNVYSEVTLTRATDDNEGGICGRLGYGAYVEHCTQNARITSGDSDPDRGGICGYQCGSIRYCVNMQSVDCNWDCVGGITGESDGGTIEYCLNSGQVSGGGDTQYAGGICGRTKGDTIIFGCMNTGRVYSSDDDDIGGILGELNDGTQVCCCINTGQISGDDRIGGIVGYGWCSNCLNLGAVWGDDDVGAISGKTAGRCEWGRALMGTCGRLRGNGDDNGPEWVSADDIISGKVCYDLNRRGDKITIPGYLENVEAVFYQNLGGDSMPLFTGQKVSLKNGDYVNDEYEVRVEYNKEYGEVKGAGSYEGGKVTLEAVPAEGCVFDHFEVKRPLVESRRMNGGNHDYPSEEVKTVTDKEFTLTSNIDRSYQVKAVFTVFDDTPDDMKQKVTIELECTDDAGGWNSESIPVYLIDSSQNRHIWEVNKNSLDDEGEKQSHTFDIGANSPVSIEAWPDFGGGVTFRDYSLKARMWINDSDKAIESDEVTIRSWPFASSKYGQDYMNINFRNMGNSSVGTLNELGEFEAAEKFDECDKAWDAVKRMGNGAVIKLESAWILNGDLVLDGNRNVTLDLNGYPVIRPLKKTIKNGNVIKVNKGSTLTVIDSNRSSRTSSAFRGGSIQGGRSTNSGGIIDVEGKLIMNGGALYNGGTTDDGGGIRCKGGSIELNGVIISGCWTSQSSFYDNEGGGIYLSDGAKAKIGSSTIKACKAYDYGGGIFIEGDNSSLDIRGSEIAGCRAEDNDGGAIYQNGGNVEFINGAVSGCGSDDNDGGGIHQNKGELYCKNIEFTNNYAEQGGALFINTNDQTYLIGCSLSGNTAENEGGAIYLDDNYLYVDNCEIVGNASNKKGGAIYLTSDGSIDLSGKVLIKKNDGAGTMDNLVMEKGAYIYDAGLDAGSEVHVRSTKDGSVDLAKPGYEISEYQLANCFVGDAPEGLKLNSVKEEDTRLHASTFSEGGVMLFVGGLMLLIAAIKLIKSFRGKKGERS